MQQENEIIQTKGHFRQQPSGMTANLKVEALTQNSLRAPFRFGFTLIELLVVVLIIAILAAIALPQYQRTVFKSRMTEVVVGMRHAADMFEVYYLEHGDYPSSWSKTDISLPGCAVKVDALGDIICNFYRMDLNVGNIWAWDQAKDTGDNRLRDDANVYLYYYFKHTTSTYAGKFRCLSRETKNGQYFCKQLCGQNTCTFDK